MANIEFGIMILIKAKEITVLAFYQDDIWILRRMAKTALVFVSHGCEEIETVTIIDVLRRSQISVTVHSISGPHVRGANGIEFNFASDRDVWNEVFDAVIVPGGSENAATLCADGRVCSYLHTAYTQKKLIAAICAGPTVLQASRVALGRSITSYPSFKEQLENDYKYSGGDSVVVDDSMEPVVVTANGPASAIRFALAIVSQLQGAHVYDSVSEMLLYV